MSILSRYLLGWVVWSHLSFCSDWCCPHRGNLGLHCSWCIRFCWGNCSGGRTYYWLWAKLRTFIIVLLFLGRRSGSTRSFQEMILFWDLSSFALIRSFFHAGPCFPPSSCPIPSASRSWPSFSRRTFSPAFSSTIATSHCDFYPLIFWILARRSYSC